MADLLGKTAKPSHVRIAYLFLNVRGVTFPGISHRYIVELIHTIQVMLLTCFLAEFVETCSINSASIEFPTFGKRIRAGECTVRLMVICCLHFGFIAPKI